MTEVSDSVAGSFSFCWLVRALTLRALSPVPPWIAARCGAPSATRRRTNSGLSGLPTPRNRCAVLGQRTYPKVAADITTQQSPYVHVPGALGMQRKDWETAVANPFPPLQNVSSSEQESLVRAQKAARNGKAPRQLPPAYRSVCSATGMVQQLGVCSANVFGYQLCFAAIASAANWLLAAVINRSGFAQAL